MTFYEKLVEVCAQQNTTPTAVCRAIGLSDAAATKWRRDGATPRDTTLKKVADHLGISVNSFKPTYIEHGELHVNGEFFKDTRVVSREEMTAKEIEELMIIRLVELFRQVPEKDRELVLNMVETKTQKHEEP